MSQSRLPRLGTIRVLLVLVSLVLGACGGEPGAAGAPEDAEGSGDFCLNVAALEIAMREDRPGIQAVLESQTPAGFEEQVAVIGQFIEIVEDGGDPHQDADFLDAYDNAWNDLRDHCGLRGQGG